MNFVLDALARLLMPKPTKTPVGVREVDPLTVHLGMIPEGWWLYGLFHNHTPIARKGDVHKPCDPHMHGSEPWIAKLQHVSGGKLTCGSGSTPHVALASAVLQVELDKESGRFGE